MTAINVATDIPTRIVKLEQLHCWASDLLHVLYKDTTIEETRGVLERACQVTPFFATGVDPDGWLITNRNTFRLADVWNSPGQDRFMNVQELGVIAIPNEWKS